MLSRLLLNSTGESEAPLYEVSVTRALGQAIRWFRASASACDVMPEQPAGNPSALTNHSLHSHSLTLVNTIKSEIQINNSIQNLAFVRRFQQLFINSRSAFSASTIMPLVVPGINSTMGDNKTAEWQQKLLGKKIGETSDEVVCFEVYKGCNRGDVESHPHLTNITADGEAWKDLCEERTPREAQSTQTWKYGHCGFRSGKAS